MPQVAVTLLAAPTSAHRKATISSSAGVTTLPLTSAASDFDGIPPSWVEVERPGREPLLIRSGDQLVTETLAVTLTPQQPGQSVDALIAELAAHARADEVIVAFGSLEAGNRLNKVGRWVITGMPVTSEERQEGSNDVSLATMRIELKQSSPVI